MRAAVKATIHVTIRSMAENLVLIGKILPEQKGLNPYRIFPRKN
jgi:hypothetical protein